MSLSCNFCFLQIAKKYSQQPHRRDIFRSDQSEFGYACLIGHSLAKRMEDIQSTPPPQKQWFSNLGVHSGYLESLLKHRFLGYRIQQLRQGPCVCISNKPPGDAGPSKHALHCCEACGNMNAYIILGVCQGAGNDSQIINQSSPLISQIIKTTFQ